MVLEAGKVAVLTLDSKKPLHTDSHSIVFGPFDDQTAAEQFIDQKADEANEYPIDCEYCGEVGPRAEIHLENFWTKEMTTFLSFECKKPNCCKARDYHFDLGKAMAKGEA